MISPENPRAAESRGSFTCRSRSYSPWRPEPVFAVSLSRSMSNGSNDSYWRAREDSWRGSSDPNGEKSDGGPPTEAFFGSLEEIHICLDRDCADRIRILDTVKNGAAIAHPLPESFILISQSYLILWCLYFCSWIVQ